LAFVARNRDKSVLAANAKPQAANRSIVYEEMRGASLPRATGRSVKKK
jgi:hypothetical protein